MANRLRKQTPKRRTDVPTRTDYRKYREELRADFDCHCGYCGDRDWPRKEHFEIDHFVPQKLDVNRKNDYTNLVYSCRSCNNSKRAKWPTGDIRKPNNGKEGWIDPCDATYSEQFERIVDGSVRSKTVLGQWMWEALTLGNPIHRLKWTLEQLRVELKKTDTLEIENVDQLKKIKELNARYRKYEEQLRGFPNFY